MWLSLTRPDLVSSTIYLISNTFSVWWSLAWSVRWAGLHILGLCHWFNSARQAQSRAARVFERWQILFEPRCEFQFNHVSRGAELEGRQSYSVVLPCGKPTSTISADTYCSEIPHRDFSQRSEKMTVMTVVEMKMLLVGRLR